MRPEHSLECPACLGTGIVVLRVGTLCCGECGGTGWRRWYRAQREFVEGRPGPELSEEGTG
jgi:hypothetical protein